MERRGVRGWRFQIPGIHHAKGGESGSRLALLRDAVKEQMDRKKVRIIFASVLALACLAAIFLLWNRPGPVIHFSKQPSTVHYDHGDPYVVRARGYGPIKIWAGRQSNLAQSFWDFEYGHVVNIDITGCEGITQSNWTPNGVEIVFSTDHKLFIPKRSFIGGR